jgi:glycosyltransferase involved in cell wall biosynthesis
LDEDLKLKVGKAARAKVVEKYNWTNNIQQMIDLYRTILK